MAAESKPAESKPLQIIKIVNSPVTIKKVTKEDNLDLNIPCRLCTKWFANGVAIRNHLRMEHSGEEVNLNEWIQAALCQNKQMRRKINKKLQTKGGQQLIAKKTADIISEMQPISVMSLASQNASYIIMKSEDGGNNAEKPNNEETLEKKKEIPVKKRRRVVKERNKLPKKQRTSKKNKEEMLITGPFECMHPSKIGSEEPCREKFIKCCDYSIHVRDEHTLKRKPNKCQVCEKVLACAIGEDIPYPYSCHACGVAVSSLRRLEEHARSAHTRPKRFECGVCHKRFTQKGNVRQHLRLHTGDRPYSCTYCDKKFTQKSGLGQHMATHTQDKPHRCVICGKGFIQSVQLKHHMRTHTKVSPYECVVCLRRFKQNRQMQDHMRQHTEANMTEEQTMRYLEYIGRMSEQNMVQVEVTEEPPVNFGAGLIDVRVVYDDEESVEMEQEVQQYVEEAEESELVEDNHVQLVESSVNEELTEDGQTVLNAIGGESTEAGEEGEVRRGSGNETWTVRIS